MRVLLWGYFKKKTSAELCRAKSTWKETLLFFSMTFNCKILAVLLYFCVCVCSEDMRSGGNALHLFRTGEKDKSCICVAAS